MLKQPKQTKVAWEIAFTLRDSWCGGTVVVNVCQCVMCMCTVCVCVSVAFACDDQTDE